MYRTIRNLAALLCCVAMAVQTTAKAADILGTAIYVVDGDTFDIAGPEIGVVRIRFCGIDSPERGEPGYREAKRFLHAKIIERELRCVRVNEGTVCDGRSPPTSRGRVVAQCFLDNKDVATIMIRARMACDWPKFSDSHYQRVGVDAVCIQNK
jgi:endonuclease YncB( thermonuclease family)